MAIGYENVEESESQKEELRQNSRVENKKDFPVKQVAQNKNLLKNNSQFETKKNSSVENTKTLPSEVKKIPYRFAGKETLIELIKKVMPKEFYPTKRLEIIFGVIFIAVILLSLFTFPINSLMRGDEIAAIKIGLPWGFLVFDLINPENFPLIIWALVVDTIIYLIIAYIIEVGINFFYFRAKSLTKDERGKKPKLLKVNQKKTLVDKVTAKLFDK